MKIFLDNVNVESSSGPNSFGRKLISSLREKGNEFVSANEADISLCFIESKHHELSIPRVQRLDGIYFNNEQDYVSQNAGIKRTYDSSDGVIFQSEFNRKLITKYFGEHKKHIVIHNGADLNAISAAPVLKAAEKYNDVWVCASSWRPHKRLKDNIRYFLEYKKENDVLFVAGDVRDSEMVMEPNIYYIGKIEQQHLYSLYKSSKYFIHLAWLDHCPNVVVDARACGAKIICSDSGGTKEIAGLDAIVIQEREVWDLEPIRLYDPPKMDFNNKVENNLESDVDMAAVSRKYENFMKEFV
jgi:glycosyltransferase involved in cell wall biosynthesis